MIIWTIQTTIISIVLIMIMHNLFAYFTKTLTVPKIKDLVNAPRQKYGHIFDTISSQYQSPQQYQPQDLGINSDMNSTNISDLTTINKGEMTSMKNELKSFLKKQLNTKPPQQQYEFSSPAYSSSSSAY